MWDDRQEPSGAHGGIARHRKDTASLGSVIGALCRTRTELDGAASGETAPSRQNARRIHLRNTRLSRGSSGAPYSVNVEFIERRVRVS